MAAALDFSALLSIDNAARKAAEAGFDALRESQPQVVATQLVAAFTQPCDPAVRELCAVLARRYLPAMFRGFTQHQFSVEVREHVKSGLLSALSAEHPPSLRRKLCSVVGRLGAEFHADNSWPELSSFVQQACGSGVASVHHSALSVLDQMAPAIVEPESWQRCGAPVQAMLLDGLAAGRAPEVQAAALSALAALLRTSANQERDAESRLLSARDATARKSAKAVRKAYKMIAAGLGETLPAMLGVLEGALQAGGEGGAALAVLENLTEVAELQPRLFKGVLPQVVEGMASLALSQLPAEQRIASAELLVTLVEAQPKMCLKLPGFLGKMVSLLLALMVRLGEDASEWEEAEPLDGLFDDDDCSEDDKEAEYASEALDRLCAAVEGKGVVELLLPQVEQLVGGGAWQQRHAALVAVGTACEACGAGLEPHLGSLAQLVATCAAAPEPRVRWAATYCLGLLADEFESLANEHHAALMPLVLGGISDGSPRVQAAACLAACNLCGQMEASTLESHNQPLLGALHARLGASPRPFVATAVASALSTAFDTLGDAVAPTYATFMPMLRAAFEAAMNAKSTGGYKLASTALGAMSSLAAAVGAAHFAADAEAVVAPLVQLVLQHRAFLVEVGLLEPLHASLSKMAKPMGAAFQPHMGQLLPALLEAAAVETEVQTDLVEEEVAEPEDSGFDTTYVANQTGSYVRVRVNSTQMQEKELAVGALHEYAMSLGTAFAPFVQAAVQAAGTLLTYSFSPRVRLSSAFLLIDSIQCVVDAGAKGEGGVSASDGAALVGSLLKPLADALHKERELEPADAMLTVFLEVLKLQRTAGAALLSPPQLNGVVELLKHQLIVDAKRLEARADAAQDDEEGDEGGADEDELELEWEILLTVTHCVSELLRQHGAAIVPTLEAQVLPTLDGWLGADANHRAAALYVLSDLIEHGGPEAAKRYTQLALPHMQRAAELTDESNKNLVAAAAAGLGAVAQFGGKLLSRGAAADTARKLGLIVQAADARCSDNLDRTEAAALALGKMLVHRTAHLEAVGLTAPVSQLFLGCLPLRGADGEEAQQDALRLLCALLDGEATKQTVLGGDGAHLPQVLGIIGAAAGKEATGAELSGAMQRLVLGWQAANPALLQASASGLSQPVQQNLAKLVSAA